MFKNKIINLSILIILIATLASACSLGGSSQEGDKSVFDSAKVEYLGEKPEDPGATLYFFWGDGCPHCAREEVFLQEMKEKYPSLEIKMYETWNNRNNARALQEMAKAYQTQAKGVPMTFLGDFAPWVGFSTGIESNIETKIQYCLENECIDPISNL